MAAPLPRVITIPLTLWAVLALIAGGAGWLGPLQPPVPQLLLAGLTVALLVLGQAVSAYRTWRETVDLRVFVALHVTRFVGVFFLILYRRGELPFAFAVPGGVGDILVAIGAVVLLLVGAPTTSARLSGYRIWNVLGLIDILFVVATAARLAFTNPGSMQSLLVLPLSILPTFLVPLIIATHIWLFGRLRSAAAS